MAEPQIQTVHIKIPKADGTGGMVPPSKSEAPTIMAQEHVVTRPPAEAKKDTSKIPLAAAKPTGGPTVMATPPTEGPKTIRIKPKPATAQTQKVAQAGILAEEDDGDDSGSLALSDKRKTSRISLEAAMTTEPTPGGAGSDDTARPKTIRLKRPSEAATVKVSAQPGTSIPEPALSSTTQTEGEPLMPMAASLEETSKLDMPPPAEDDGSQTRRKTIKVKRPTQRPEVPMSLGVSGGGAGHRGAGDLAAARHAAQAIVKPDTMNATFPIFAIVTMIVMLITIYLFCTEAIGPNPCLTDYSYYKEGADLSWPGKISPFTR
jgi:hypothetical protein